MWMKSTSYNSLYFLLKTNKQHHDLLSILLFPFEQFAVTLGCIHWNDTRISFVSMIRSDTKLNSNYISSRRSHAINAASARSPFPCSRPNVHSVCDVTNTHCFHILVFIFIEIDFLLLLLRYYFHKINLPRSFCMKWKTEKKWINAELCDIECVHKFLYAISTNIFYISRRHPKYRPNRLEIEEIKKKTAKIYEADRLRDKQKQM